MEPDSPELLPESPGHVVLEARGGQVTEDDLQVAQDTNVVLLPVLRLAEGRLVVKLVMVAEHLVPRVHIALREGWRNKPLHLHFRS